MKQMIFAKPYLMEFAVTMEWMSVPFPSHKNSNKNNNKNSNMVLSEDEDNVVGRT